MISYKKAEQKDLNEIMEVISDVALKSQEESKNKIVDRISREQLLCCISDDKIIGFIGWDTKFQNNPEHWYLEQITIQKDYRNKGIGQNFVKYFLDICRNEKVKKIYAHVQEHNTQSLKMFLNVGGIINTEPEKSVSNEITIEFGLL
ncbi:MAG: GNAT family N-acetyltransferase [Candidatus Zambryskibacteria bacterium]